MSLLTRGSNSVAWVDSWDGSDLTPRQASIYRTLSGLIARFPFCRPEPVGVRIGEENANRDGNLVYEVGFRIWLVARLVWCALFEVWWEGLGPLEDGMNTDIIVLNSILSLKHHDVCSQHLSVQSHQ